VKYLDEFHDSDKAQRLLARIAAVTTRPWALMEVCGGQTHSIIRHGIDQLLPPQLELIHGPGCPVCVTPLETLDKALAIAARPDVVFCSFGDMLRVPGSEQDLFGVRSAAVTSASSTARSTRSRSRPSTPSGRWSSSGSASRRPHPRTRWPCSARTAAG
jgi:hydrogenase expression/formation protein HypD